MMATKRSFFKRPAWASTASTAESATVTEPVFGRQRIFDDIVAIEKKQKEEKERKAKEEAARKEEYIPPLKKRRISEDDDKAGSDASLGTKGKDEPMGRASKPEASEHKAVTRNPPQKGKLSNGLGSDTKSPRGKASATVITLGNDDSDDDIAHTSTSKRSSGRSKARPRLPDPDAELLESDDEDDPYLLELKARARAQRAAAEVEKANAPTSTPIEAKSPTATPGATERDQSLDPTASKSITASVSPGPTQSAADDPEVSLYIKPLLPNTKALIVGRKASQTIEAVKTFWCKKQGLTEAESAKVFFTWRDIKIFPSSTMRHIVSRLESERKPGQKESGGRIVLEAVTQEIFDHQLAEKARREAREAAKVNDTDEDFDDYEEDEVKPVKAPRKGEKFIIKLMSKEYGEMPIRIRPESTIGKIASGYVQQMVKDGDGKTPYLIFDGDRLESDSTAEDIGLEEGDVVEVQFP